MNETFPASERFCPRCSGVVDTDARFCKHCAFDLSQSIPDSDATVVKPNIHQTTGSKRTFIIAGIAIVAFLLIVFMSTYLYKRNRAQQIAATSSPTPSLPTMSDRAKQVEDKILRNDSLNENDISGLSAYELRVLRNVHFARYGRKYDQGGELGGYFYTRPWYKPSDTYNDKQITETDKGNINLILAAEKSVNNSQADNQRSNVAVATPDNAAPSTPLSRSDLSRETVLALARARFANDVTVSMNTSSNVYGHGNITDLYDRMIQAKIIVCRRREPMSGGCGCWTGCTPGPSSHGLTMTEQGNNIVSGSMSLMVGAKKPSVVTGISRIDQTSAIADVQFTFEANSNYSFYSQWSNAFWRPPDTQNEVHRFLLRLYDDGWRIERTVQ